MTTSSPGDARTASATRSPTKRLAEKHPQLRLVTLWNRTNLGYLTVQAATLGARGAIANGATSLDAGRLGSMDVRGSEVLRGEPLV